MTLLKDNNYKEINVALLSLEADINKLSNNGSFDTSVIDRQLAEINSRIDKINAGGNSSAAINYIRTEIEDINSKLNVNSVKIENIERNIEGIDTQINGIEQKLSDIFSAENKVTDFNATTGSGVYYWVNSSANKPVTDSYGVLLVNKYDGGDSANNLWVNQIAYCTNGKIYFRQNINSTGWTEWKAVAFDGEIKASFLDEYPGAGGTRLTSGNIVPKDASEYGGMRKDVVTSSMTDSGHPGQDGHLLTMFWDNSGRHDSQLFVSNEKQPTTVKVRVKANEADYGPWVDLITSQNIGSQTVAKASTAGTADKAVEVVDYGNTSRTVKIGYSGPGITADKLLHLAGYTEMSGSSVKIKDVSKEELIKWLGIPKIKYADYKTPTQTFTQFQQVPIELSKFSSEVTPDNVLCFMVVHWNGVTLIASADYKNAPEGLKCALTALGAGTGSATIRCVYMI